MMVSEPPFDVARGAKKRLACSALASTPLKILARRRTRVVGAREAGDRVEQDAHWCFCSARLRLVDHHSATWTWRVAGSSNVDDTTSAHAALHVGHLFGRSSTSSTMRKISGGCG